MKIKKSGHGFAQKLMAVVLVMAFSMPIFATTAMAANPYSKTTTFTYVDDSGLFKIEIDGYIGSIEANKIPKIPQYYNDGGSGEFSGYVDIDTPIHVFIVDEVQTGFPQLGRIYPVNASYIAFDMHDWKYINYSGGLSRLEEYHYIRGLGVSLNSLKTLTTNDPTPFNDASNGWESDVNDGDLRVIYVWEYKKNSNGEIDWNSGKRVETAVNATGSKGIPFNLIVLTPSLADEFLATGILTHDVASFGMGAEYIQREIQVPGLRELILAARGETTSTETPSGWAVEQVNQTITAGLVPQLLQSKYTQATTRAEFCALAVALYENVKGEITGRTTFVDTNDVNVQKMASIGVVSGVGDNRFDPNAQLTREQAAVMLSRLANAIGKPFANNAPTFADNGNISSWAVDGVGAVQSAGIMSGVGNNKFAPKDPYTREQSIITILRVFNAVNIEPNINVSAFIISALAMVDRELKPAKGPSAYENEKHYYLTITEKLPAMQIDKLKWSSSNTAVVKFTQSMRYLEGTPVNMPETMGFNTLSVGTSIVTVTDGTYSATFTITVK